MSVNDVFDVFDLDQFGYPGLPGSIDPGGILPQRWRNIGRAGLLKNHFFGNGIRNGLILADPIFEEGSAAAGLKKPFGKGISTYQPETERDVFLSCNDQFSWFFFSQRQIQR